MTTLALKPKTVTLTADGQQGYEIVQAELPYLCIADVAAEADVSTTTLYNWAKGKTKAPQFYKVLAVLRALGYTVTITNTGRPKARSR